MTRNTTKDMTATRKTKVAPKTKRSKVEGSPIVKNAEKHKRRAEELKLRLERLNRIDPRFRKERMTV